MGLSAFSWTVSDVPPPGVGLKTEIWQAPAEVMSVAGISTNSCVPSTTAALLAPPLTLTTELPLKPEPCTVSVNASSPAIFVDGEILLMVGLGLLTVRVAGSEVPPPGVGTPIPSASTSMIGVCGEHANTWPNEGLS